MEKKINEVKTKEELSGDIEIVFLEAVLMPNGEIIRNGKTIEWVKVNNETNTIEERIFKPAPKPCEHICTGECRKIGCNCACGEFHKVEVNEYITIPMSESDVEVIREGGELNWTFPTDKGRQIDVTIKTEEDSDLE